MKKLFTARNIALLGLLGALLGLLTATRTWVLVDVVSSTVQVPQIVVPGSTAAASVTAVCVAVLAGALALLIAGKIARYLIGVITLLAGVAVIAAGAGALSDPQGAAAGAVSEATGLAQSAGDYALTFWPAITVVAGVLIIVQAVLVLIFSGGWRKTSKYDREAAKGKETPKDSQSQNISHWEQLSSGEDPTANGN